MPRGVPRFNTGAYTPRSTKLDSATEDLLQLPETKLIGEMDLNTLTTNTSPTASWTGPDGGTVEITEPPPPWELNPGKRSDNTDARRFVDAPANISLRWINPRELDHSGWRDWQPVMASDPRFKVKVRQMIAVDNTIRRGGLTGDILGWMYTRWVESRAKIKAEKTMRIARGSVDRQEALKEAYNRGKFGPYVRMTSSAHPSHTIAEGRSLEKD